MPIGLIDQAWREVEAALGSPDELIALLSVIAAAALVLVSGFVKTMIPLRWLAIGSNLGFIAYGALHPSYPMLLLHAALLPLNVYRLAEMVRLTRRVVAVTRDHDAGVWLKPYMRSARVPAGTVLFSQGDLADRLYMLAEGRIELVENGKSLIPGQIFGEIAFFSPDRRRSFTARCAVPCTVLSIDEVTMKQLYFQNPAFGFRLIELVASRFASDVARLNATLQEIQAGQAARASQALQDPEAVQAVSTAQAVQAVPTAEAVQAVPTAQAVQAVPTAQALRAVEAGLADAERPQPPEPGNVGRAGTT